MGSLNPWQTDSSADDFIQAVTALDDAAYVMLQKADPNNAGQGIWIKITGANLKTALNKGWVGNRRENATPLTVNTSGGFASLITNTITPSAANVRIRIRGNIFGDLTTSPSANGRSVFYARWKSGTGNYRAIHAASAARTQIKGHVSLGSNYFDWVQGSGFFEYFIRAPNTDPIKVNIEGNPRIANADQSNMYFNRNQSNARDYECISFLELTEFREINSDEPIEVTTVTTADAA